MRELEKGAVKSAQQRAEADSHSGTAEPLTRYMMRSVACFQRQGVAFVDTQPRGWQALHCNLAFTDVSCVSGLPNPVQGHECEVYGSPHIACISASSRSPAGCA